jgi:hypothetical protein
MDYLVVNNKGRVLAILESLEEVALWWFRRMGKTPTQADAFG